MKVIIDIPRFKVDCLSGEAIFQEIHFAVMTGINADFIESIECIDEPEPTIKESLQVATSEKPTSQEDDLPQTRK